MKVKLIETYSKIAKEFSKLSSATRLKVGAIIVTDSGRIISTGYNGMPSGWDNGCEYLDSYGEVKTNREVLHAESNALTKCLRDGESTLGTSMFCTHSPCFECAKLIYQSGIKNVYYTNKYRDDAGISFLINSGVNVTQITEIED